MRKVLSRFATIVVTCILWLFAGARILLDLVGYSTVPDDVGTAKSRLMQAVEWFSGIPSLIVYISPVALTIILAIFAWWPSRVRGLPAESVEGYSPNSRLMLELVHNHQGGEDRIVTLRSSNKLQFDCADGKNFYFEMREHTVLEAPINPKEGVYRIYLVPKAERKTLAVKLPVRFDYLSFPSGELDQVYVFEFLVLNGSGGFQYFARQLYTTSRLIEERAVVPRDFFRANGKAIPISSSLYRDVDCAHINIGDEIDFFVDEPSGYYWSEVQFNLVYHTDGPVDGVNFSVSLRQLSSPISGGGGESISLDLNCVGRRVEVSEWGEGDLRISSPTRQRYRISVVAPDDFLAKIYVYQINIRFIMNNFRL